MLPPNPHRLHPADAARITHVAHRNAWVRTWRSLQGEDRAAFHARLWALRSELKGAELKGLEEAILDIQDLSRG